MHIRFEFFTQRLTVTTQNGPSGLIVAQLVEVVPKHGQESVPIPLQSMAGKTAMNWDQLIRPKNVTQILAVSIY